MGNMNIKQLEDELETWGLDYRNINIGDRPYYDECFNLIHRTDGSWEIFYGEHGQKTNPQVFEDEEEACYAFYELIRKNMGGPKLEDKPEYWKGYQRNASKFQLRFITGIFIFGVLMGVAGLIYQIVTSDTGMMFWIWIGWIIVFGILTYCSLNERRSEKLEFFGQFLIEIFCILAAAGCMIGVSVSAITQFISGEADIYAFLAPFIVAPCGGVWIYFLCKSIRNEYGGYFKELINKKKGITEDGEDSSRSEDNP